MVRFSQNKGTYLTSMMERLNKFRQDSSLCDICIVVDHHKLHAHKNVLAAGSDYFNSYFLGPLAEESATEVNISFLTTDIKEVEQVIDFLYTGEIDIDFENLEAVVKIASFFLIKEIRDLCTEFMLSKNELDDYLRLYLIAVDYMIPEVVNKLELSVKSRFHDYIIFQKQATNITLEQLSYLVTKLDIFEYCDVFQIVYYFFAWVELGGTHKHDTLACEIFDTDSVLKQVDGWCKSYAVSKIAKSEVSSGLCDANIVHTDESVDSNDVITGNSKQTTETTQSKEHVVKQVDKTSKLVSAVVECVLENTRFDTNIQNLALKRLGERLLYYMPELAGTGKKSSIGHPQDSDSLIKTEPSMEHVLITISPTPNLIELFDHFNEPEWGNCLNEDEDYYDVCLFVPRKAAWLHYKAIRDDGLFDALTGESGHNYQYIEDKICGAYTYQFEQNDVYMHSLKDFTYTTIFFDDLHDDMPQNEYISNHNVSVITDDQTVYLVLKILVSEHENSEDTKQVYFRCFKHADEHSWSFLCQTVSIDTTDQNSKTTVHISSVSNEIIIVYNDQATHVFRINISDESPAAIKLNLNDSSESREDANAALDCSETVNPAGSDENNAAGGDLNNSAGGGLNNAAGGDVNNVVGEVDSLAAARDHASNTKHDVTIHILEGQDQLYILEVTMPESSLVPIKVRCKFTYRYNSLVLTGPSSQLFYVENNASGSAGAYPCHLRYVSSHGKSVWIFCGTVQDGSYLVEVVLDYTGALHTVRHTPPPFSRVLATIPGKISSEYIKSAKEATGYISCY